MKKKTFRMPIRVVFYQEDDGWVARCLEFDLIGHAPSQKESLDLLAEAIEIQAENMLRDGNPDNFFTPAEPKYHRMYAQGRHIADGELKIELHKMRDFVVEGAEVREYDEEMAMA